MIVIETRDIDSNYKRPNASHGYISDCTMADPFYPVSKMKGLEVDAITKSIADIEKKLNTLINTLNDIDECVILELSMEKVRGKDEYVPNYFSCFSVVVMIALQQYLEYDSSNIVIARKSDNGVDMKEYLLKIMPSVIEKAFDIQPYIDDVMSKYGDAND